MEFEQASVGIIIRTRDRPLFVQRALHSVLAQSHANWQVQLINDGGDSEALERAVAAVRPVPAGRLHVDHLGASVGRAAAFNLGLNRLDTEFVTCLDDDDSWSPDFLQSLVAFHRATARHVPDLGGVMCRLTAIREEVIGQGAEATIITLGEDDLPNAFKRNDFFINPIAYACYRQDMYPVQWMLVREAARAVGGFPADFDVMEDRAFMTRFLQHWRLAVLDRKLAFHHRRARRSEDVARQVEMNTVDNPSYDWRLYADLARIPAHSPPDEDPALAAQSGLVRGVAATVLREINDETSALWHKLDGLGTRLERRLDALENRLANVTAPARPDHDPARLAYALWDQLGDHDIGHALAPGQPFATRFELSQGFDCPGRLLHASREQGRFVVQLPQTRDWSAIEFSLSGLAEAGGGLRCMLDVVSDESYLFETALSIWEPDRLGRLHHRFVEQHVHSCPPNGHVLVTRDFSGANLDVAKKPKLSIILPRQATNFRFCCRDLVIWRH